MAGLLALNFIRGTELSATNNLSAEHETPPIANVLLCAAILSIQREVQSFCRLFQMALHHKTYIE